MRQAPAGPRQRARFLRGALAAMLVAAAVIVPSTLTASAYQLQTAALTGATGTNGTVVQTFPSGLTATWATSGVTTVSSLTNAMSAKSGTSAMFTPGISATTPMPDFVTDGAGCAANGTCANRGTITLTFSRPVRNPVLHIAGLGGYVTQSGQTTTLRASGTITSTSPGGATMAAPAANAVNLAVGNAGQTWDTSVTRPAVACNTTTIAGQNGFAGCGSIPVTGLVRSLTFRIDLNLVSTGGTASLSNGDDFLMGVTVPEDFGDAPASYDAGTAASAIPGDLALGESVDAENAATANATTSPNAVAAGANANTPNGDGADENALTGFPALTTATIGSPYAVTVPISGAGAAGQVCGWIDFNRGGTFEAGESACAAFASGATSVTLSWTVPTATSAGTTYARLRASYNTTQVASPTGRADSGEVEDYSLAVLPVVRVNKVVPYGGTGTFDLSVNGTTVATAAGDGGSSGSRTLFHTAAYGSPDLTVAQNVATAAVPLTISEVASGTTTGSYSSALACVDATGATVATAAGTAGSVSVPASTGSNGRQQNITCTFTNTPGAALTLTKSVAGVSDTNNNGLRDAGDVVTYSLLVHNSGGAPVTGLGINDVLLTGETCPSAALAQGVSTTCTGTHVLTQAEVDAGTLTNTATAAATAAGTPVTSSPSSAVLTVTPSPGLELSKSVNALTDTNGSGVPDAGDSISWSFGLTNTGTVTLNTLAVSDPTAGPVTCAATTLAPGASTSCTAAAHTITQAEGDAGVVTNTATASGQTPAGANTASNPAGTSTPLTLRSTLTLTKSATVTDLDTSGDTSRGDTVTWSFLVRNTGSVTLSSLEVSDPTAGTVTCPVTSLTPGASTTCTAPPHTVTQADVDAGLLSNTATATGSGPGGASVQATSSTDSPIAQSRGLALAKSAVLNDVNGNGRIDAGDEIAWSFLVTNSGTVTLAALAIADPVAGAVTCPVSVLAPGASTTCTAPAHTITPADVDAGVVSNTATATGQAPAGGPVVSQTSSTDTPVVQASGLSLVKSAAVSDLNGNGITDLADRITWSFGVANTGTTTISAISVADPVAGAVTCPVTSLAAGASTTCTAAAHTVTQADVDAGVVSNTATAGGSDPSGLVVTTSPAFTDTPVAQNRALSLTKSASVTDLDGNGTELADTITWSFLVRNTGTVTVAALAVADPVAGAVTCPAASLAPGASTLCSAAARTITQADVDAGVVSNTATATGQAPAGGPVVSQTSSTDTPVVQASGLSLAKSASVTDLNGSGFTDLGDAIAWSFLVTNPGTVTVTGLAVTDPTAGPVTCPVTSLAPGAATTCTAAATHTVTQADVDAAEVTNSATASATGSDGAPVSATDTAAARVEQDRGLNLTKSATVTDLNGSGFTDLGDSIDWSFQVLNTGTVSLTAISVNDARTAVTCPPGPLAPSASIACTGDIAHTVTQADVDAGLVSNSATATATDAAANPVAAGPSSTDTPVTASRGLGLVKSAAVTDPDGNGTDLGDTITWSFLVTNTGTTSLSGLVVSDPTAGTVSCPVTSLAPGASTTCTAGSGHTVTQADVDAGVLSNTATAGAATPSGAAVAAPPSSTDTPVTASGGLTLVKSAVVTDVDGDGATDLGDQIGWTFTVTNAGTVTLTSLAVTDPTAGAVSCPIATLAPGGSTTCTAAAHTVTQADVDAAAVHNTATASARTPGGATLTADSSVTTPVEQTRGLSVLKTAQVSDTDASGSVTAGDVVGWSFLVTNTGTVTVAAIAVDDARTPVSCPVTVLAPGAWATCTATSPHLVTQADVDAGQVANTATAHGEAPLGGPVVSQTSSTDTPVAQSRAVGLVKSAAVTDVNGTGRTDLGDLVTWSFAVTNTGTVTVASLAVTDPTAGPVTCPVSSLAPSASTTCTAAAHTVTQADVDAGLLSNTATAAGQAPAGGPVVSQTSSTDTPIAQSAALTLTKSALASDGDGDGNTELGDTVSWSFLVANTGTVTVGTLAISDPVAGPVTCPALTLAPGASTTCTADADHVVVQADVDAAVVSNSATVSGTTPLGQPVADGPSTTDTPLAHAGALTLVKSAAVSDPGGDGTALGDTITWSFLASNTGAVTLTGLGVSDPTAGPVSCPVTTLAPGASTTCAAVASHTVTQADVDAGVVANTATATATDPDGATVPASASSTSTAIQQLRGLRTVKAAVVGDLNGNGITDLGDTIAWSFTVTNTGTVTVEAFAVNDPVAGAVTCPVGTLAPSASTVCTADVAHLITQADVDAGIVSNVATTQGEAPLGGPVVSQTSSTDTPVAQSSGLQLVKAATVNDLNSDGATDLGDTVTWSFTVTNAGSVSVHGLAITDPVAGAVTCPATALGPGAATTCTADAAHPVTQADVDAGVVSNTATAAALDPSGRAVTANPAVTDTPVAQVRGLRLVKSAAVTDVGGNGITDLGDAITWSFTVTNTGSVGAASLAVTDPLAGPVACAATTLAPGVSISCTAAAHAVTQGDVDAGVVSNTATAAALDPSGGALSSAPSATDTPIARSGGVRLVKSATLNDTDGNGADLGDSLSWSFLVTNTGSTTVHALAVSDPVAGAVTCPASTLAPGASTTCTASPRALTQADVDSALVSNTATASALGPDGAPVPVSVSSTGTPITQSRGLRLVKAAGVTDQNGDGVRDLGDTIAWSFQVTNTGTVTVAVLAVSDPAAGVVTCAATTLAPGVTTTCTAGTPHPIVQADMDAGVVSNTATVTGQAPAGGVPVSASASTDTPLDRSSSMTLTKTAVVGDLDGSGQTDLGDSIAWSFLVTNTGTTSLGTLVVLDPTAGPVTCSVTTLAPSASTTCAADATHPIDQGDVDAGLVSNSATASARNPSGDPVGTPASATDTPVAQARGLRLVKSVAIGDLNGNGATELGDLLPWSFLVTNTGSVTLDSLVVLDPTAGSVTCSVTTLAPSASTTCTADATHPVTQADVDAGLVSNTAIATADDPAGAPVAPSVSSTDTPISQSRALALTKTAAVTDVDGNGVTDLADLVTWSFQVRNTGSVSVAAITVTDPSAGPVTCLAATLAPGASTSCSAAAHPISQTDVDAGVVANTATAQGIAGAGPTASTVASSSSSDTPVARAQGLSLTKAAAVTDIDGDGANTLGDTLTWSFLLTNTGTVTLNALAVTDPSAGAVTCPATTLAPSAAMTCTAAGPRTVTQADVDAGVVSNTATAAGTDPTGLAVSGGPSSTDTPIAQTRGISLVKAAAVSDLDGDGTDLGDEITWSFQVTNTGSVTLDALQVSDLSAGTVSCPVTVLAPSASTICTADSPHTVTQADLDAGVLTNTATASGQATSGPTVTSAPSTTDTPLVAATTLQLHKSASVRDTDGDRATSIGDEITWTFTVTNTGSQTLTGLEIDDVTAGPVTCPVLALAPGAVTTCAADTSHPISAAEAAVGVVHNTARAGGQGGAGQVFSSNSSTATVSVKATPTPAPSSSVRPVPPRPGPLPFTGAVAVGAALALGVALLCIGFALMALAGSRRRAVRNRP